jgi:hypothetical protein
VSKEQMSKQRAKYPELWEPVSDVRVARHSAELAVFTGSGRRIADATRTAAQPCTGRLADGVVLTHMMDFSPRLAIWAARQQGPA